MTDLDHGLAGTYYDHNPYQTFMKMPGTNRGA